MMLTGAELKAELERLWRIHGLVSDTHRARWVWNFRDAVTGEPRLGGIPGTKIVKTVKRPRRRLK